VQLNHKSQGIETLMGVRSKGLLGLIPVPWTIQGRGMTHGCEKKKERQEKDEAEKRRSGEKLNRRTGEAVSR